MDALSSVYIITCNTYKYIYIYGYMHIHIHKTYTTHRPIRSQLAAVATEGDAKPTHDLQKLALL